MRIGSHGIWITVAKPGYGRLLVPFLASLEAVTLLYHLGHLSVDPAQRNPYRANPLALAAVYASAGQVVCADNMKSPLDASLRMMARLAVITVTTLIKSIATKKRMAMLMAIFVFRPRANKMILKLPSLKG